MKIIHISDTHNRHSKVRNIPDGDVLVHSGDISNIGHQDDVVSFIKWFNTWPHEQKIFIAGNHDRSFDPKFNTEVDPLTGEKTNDRPKWLSELLSSLPDNIHYLEDSSVVIDGKRFWGSPWTPWFHGTYWGFNKHRGDPIREVWKGIPMKTDVVITHGPPAHKLDWVKSGELVGCHDLTYFIEMIKPKVHLFGHIHESYGITETPDTIYSNASIMNEYYESVNKPIEIEI